MENSGPLERRAVQGLTPTAMTVFSVERPLTLQHVRNLAALAVSAPLDRAELPGVMDLVWRAVLPGLAIECVFRRVVGDSWRGLGGIGFEFVHSCRDERI